MSNLELKNLEKHHGEIRVVRGINLLLAKRRYCCLLNPSLGRQR